MDKWLRFRLIQLFYFLGWFQFFLGWIPVLVPDRLTIGFVEVGILPLWYGILLIMWICIGFTLMVKYDPVSD